MGAVDPVVSHLVAPHYVRRSHRVRRWRRSGRRGRRGRRRWWRPLRVACRIVYACVWPVFPDALGAVVALVLAAPARKVATESLILHLVTSSGKRWWWRRRLWRQGRWLWRRWRRPVCVACRIVYAPVWPVFPDALGAVVALLLAAPARKEATESLILHFVTPTCQRRRRWRRRRIGTTVAIPPLVGRAVFPDAPGARVALLAAGPPRHVVAEYSLRNVHIGAQQTSWRLWWLWRRRQRRRRRRTRWHSDPVATPTILEVSVFPDAPVTRVALLAAGPRRHVVAVNSLCIVHLGAPQPGRRRWPGWRQWRRVEIVAGLPGSRPVFIDAPGTRVALCRDGQARKETAEPFIEHPVASSPKRGIGRQRRRRQRRRGR